MSATIAFVNNGDGTATATVSGGTSGTNTIKVARWRSGLVGVSWTSAATRAGDGTATVTLEPGLYFGHVSNASSISSVVGFRVTSGDDPIYRQILDAVGDRLGAISLDRTPAHTIYVRKLPWNRNNLEAGIHVSPIREAINRVVNTDDDFSYGVQVTVVEPSNFNLTSNLTNELEWRSQIIKAFQPTPSQPPLAGVAEVYDVTVEAGPVIDPASFLLQYDVQALVLRFKTRELRGL